MIYTYTMASTVTQSTDFNTTNITFSPIKLLDMGAKQAYLNYGSRPLTMQSASMVVPYGMNVFDKAGPPKYSVDLSFRGYEDGKDKKVRAFYDALSALDEFMIEEGVKNSQQWFKSKLTADVVRAFYTPIVRISKDANGNPKPYPPTLKVSLRKKNGTDNFEVAMYDSEKKPYENVPLEDLLVKGAQVTALMQCTGVWFAGSKFGLSWKAVQIRVDKLPDSIRGFAFADDEDAPRARAPAPKSAPQPAPVMVDDEVDDEEVFSQPATKTVTVQSSRPSVVAAAAAPEELDAEGEEAEPIAVPKKSVVTKKKVVSVVKK